MTSPKSPSDAPSGDTGLAGFAVDLHDLTLLVPTDNPAPLGATAVLELRGRDGLKLRAVARVEGLLPATEQGPASMSMRLLDVRALHEEPLIVMESLRPPSLVPPADAGPLRVLVVDDDKSLRVVAARAMDIAGFEVVEASNGAAALCRRQARDLRLGADRREHAGHGRLAATSDAARRR